ncbi:MAG: hypothetical protein DMG55_16670 [Acidobacteria bacterium]|nr:MAG: hypothetical protein DMG55_16670 [Acidobacteriota bacterium]
MLEIDLKAPATSASESFVAAASAAAGIGGCPAVCVLAGAGRASLALKTQRRMQMIRHIRPRPTSELFLAMNSTRLEPSRLGVQFDRLTGHETEQTAMVVLVNGHQTSFSS